MFNIIFPYLLTHPVYIWMFVVIQPSWLQDPIKVILLLFLKKHIYHNDDHVPEPREVGAWPASVRSANIAIIIFITIIIVTRRQRASLAMMLYIRTVRNRPVILLLMMKAFSSNARCQWRWNASDFSGCSADDAETASPPCSSDASISLFPRRYDIDIRYLQNIAISISTSILSM